MPLRYINGLCKQDLPSIEVEQWITTKGRFVKPSLVATHAVIPIPSDSRLVVVIAKETVLWQKRQAIYWFLLELQNTCELRCTILCEVQGTASNGSNRPVRIPQVPDLNLLELSQKYVQTFRDDHDGNNVSMLQREGVNLDDCRVLLEYHPIVFDAPAPAPAPEEVVPRFILFRLDEQTVHPVRIGQVEHDGIISLETALETTERKRLRPIVKAIRDNVAVCTPLGPDVACVLLEQRCGNDARGTPQWFAYDYQARRPVVFLCPDPVTAETIQDQITVDKRDELLDHATTLVASLRNHARLLRNDDLVKVLTE